MIGGSIGRGAGRIINAMVRGLARHTVNPNTLTVIGVLINLVCGLLFGFGYFFYAGLVLIVANLFDMLDGKLARSTNQVTAFGGFLDSSLDRLSDMVVLVGVLIFYARDTPYHSTLNVFLVSAALVGSVLISYTSARAESLIPKCDVGFFRRPERVVLLIIGALSTHHGSTNFFANRMPAVLWILAIGSYWTFAHRMFYTWRETQRIVAAKAMATNATAAPDETSTKPHTARPTQEQLDAAHRASISR
ncbi:MAG: CDP-alcohol phosphatidyltransferase family protein [Pyrinomonadaceae bacterium MAG19_C2-C3]|nr:CDP-alcohol phosphatidyltransferase family protein [Pyrinomonadaceae bacterium MAG19_C2-C3]